MRRSVDPHSFVGPMSDDEQRRRLRARSSEALSGLSLAPETPERRARSLGRAAGSKLLARAHAHAHASDSDSAVSDAPRVKRGVSQPSSSKSRYEAPPLLNSLVAEVDLEGGVSDTQRSEGGRSSRRSTNSRKEKRPQRADRRGGATRRPRGMLIGLAVCTILFGPIATLVSYLRVTSSPSPDGWPHAPGAWTRRGAHAPRGPDSAPVGRVLHLNLAGSDVKARMVLSRHTDWEAFIAGTKERLKIDHVASVTDHSGEVRRPYTDANTRPSLGLPKTATHV